MAIFVNVISLWIPKMILKQPRTQWKIHVMRQRNGWDIQTHFFAIPIASTPVFLGFFLKAGIGCLGLVSCSNLAFFDASKTWLAGIAMRAIGLLYRCLMGYKKGVL